mgnify:CR=1 FL=1
MSLTALKKQDDNIEEIDLPFDYDNDDPYLQSAIEFMYSEDTEDDFNTMDR